MFSKQNISKLGLTEVASSSSLPIFVCGKEITLGRHLKISAVESGQLKARKRSV